MRPETRLLKEKLELSQKVQAALMSCYSLPEIEIITDLVCRRCRDVNRLSALKSKTGTTAGNLKAELKENIQNITKITSKDNEWLS